MRLIFSKDRPAQLDLLLRSLEANAPDEDTIVVVPRMTDEYTTVFLEHERDIDFVAENGRFESVVRWELENATDDLVTFFCDDDIVYRRLDPSYFTDLVLCISSRLGANTVVQYPTGLPQSPAPRLYTWTGREGDFGYPGSVDGHTFRAKDLVRMLSGRSFPNPTALECCLVAGCDELAAERPMMVTPPVSEVVGNPVNRVSEQSNVVYGQRFPITAEECLERFREGNRIDLDALDFSEVNGAHTEIELRWRRR